MADDIEVHFDPRRGELSLSCGEEPFGQIQEAVVAAAGLAGVLDGVPAGVDTIVVTKVSTARHASRLRGRIALFGCGLVGLAVLFVLAVGASTIVGWMR